MLLLVFAFACMLQTTIHGMDENPATTTLSTDELPIIYSQIESVPGHRVHTTALAVGSTFLGAAFLCTAVYTQNPWYMLGSIASPLLCMPCAACTRWLYETQG